MLLVGFQSGGGGGGGASLAVLVNGSLFPTEPGVNFIGSGVSGVDNPINQTTDITFASGGGGGGPARVVWIATNGNDSTGTGEFGSPFLTYAGALAVIGVPTVSTVFQFAPGAFGPIALVNNIVCVGWSSPSNDLATEFTGVTIDPTIGGTPTNGNC